MNVNRHISDLFFNQYHAERTRLFNSGRNGTDSSPTDEQVEAAAKADAAEFLSIIEPLQIPEAAGLTADDLAFDFLSRV